LLLLIFTLSDTLLGWDTDQFPMDVTKTTAIMSIIIKQGGLGNGGLNFDCKVRRESTEPIDLCLGHVGAMDTYARGLRNAAKMHMDGVLDTMLRERYLSFETEEIGNKIEDGTATLEECEAYAKKMGEPNLTSGKQELFEIIRNQYV
jgi:xylose isomerase